MSVAVSFYEMCSTQLLPAFTMPEQILLTNLMIPPQTVADALIRNGDASNPPSVPNISNKVVDITSSNGWFDVCLAPFTRYGVSPGQAQALATSALKQSQGDMTSHVQQLVYTGKYLQGDPRFIGPLTEVMTAVTIYGQSVLQVAIPDQYLMTTALHQYVALAGFAVTEMWFANFVNILKSVSATPPSYQTVFEICELLLLMIRYDMTQFFVGVPADAALISGVHAMALYDDNINNAIARSGLVANSTAQNDATNETAITTYTNLQNIEDSLQHTMDYWERNRATAQNGTTRQYVVIAFTWIASLMFIVHSLSMHGAANAYVEGFFAIALVILLWREAYMLFTEP